MPQFTNPPQAPQRGDRATFSQRVDAFLRWLVTFVGQLNLFVSNLNARDAGGAATFSYTFDTANSLTDPGPGKIRFDNANQSAALAIAIDNLSDTNIDVSGYVATIQNVTSNTKGSIRVERAKFPGSWILFDITSVNDNGGFKTLSVVSRASSGQSPFAFGDSLVLYFSKNGDKGDGGNTPTSQQIRDAVGILPLTNGGTGANTASQSLSNLGGVSSNSLLSEAGGKLIGFAQSITGSIKRTIFDKAAEVKSFEDFGAVGDGVADDYAAMQKAIDWAASLPFATVRATPGARYKISSGLVVKFDNKFQDPTSTVKLDFTGSQIIPAAANISCLKASRDFVTIINPVVNNTQGNTGIIAYAVMPEDPSQSTKKVSQQFCRLVNPVAMNVDVGIKQMPGPTVSGSASGSFYNMYEKPIALNTKCAIWMAGNPNALDVLNTRTTITNPQHLSGNCSFYFEAADTTEVVGGGSENITIGTWPVAAPTTIYIPRKFTNHVLDNNGIRFTGFTGETGVVPYNIDAFYCPLTNCGFIGYTQPSVGDQTRTQWTNEGAVGSTSDKSGKLAQLFVKAPSGKQAYLAIEGSGSSKPQFYADNGGFVFVSPADIADIRTTKVGGQLIGGDGITLAVGGSGQDITLYNLSNAGAGGFTLGGGVYVRPDTDNAFTLGTATRRWSTVYSTSGSINTSDRNSKCEIGAIDEKALRAMSHIDFVQFKFIDAVERKGDEARWHFGVIAQQVKDAFEAEGLNGFDYGLLCYDEWSDQYEPVIAEREVDLQTPDGNMRTITETYYTGEQKLVQPAGNRYGVRYDELYSLGFAYLMSQASK